MDIEIQRQGVIRRLSYWGRTTHDSVNRIKFVLEQPVRGYCFSWSYYKQNREQVLVITFVIPSCRVVYTAVGSHMVTDRMAKKHYYIRLIRNKFQVYSYRCNFGESGTLFNSLAEAEREVVRLAHRYMDVPYTILSRTNYSIQGETVVPIDQCKPNSLQEIVAFFCKNYFRATPDYLPSRIKQRIADAGIPDSFAI